MFAYCTANARGCQNYFASYSLGSSIAPGLMFGSRSTRMRGIPPIDGYGQVKQEL